ncbi:MAG: hypothetical protein IPJ19_19180 [Planctomycetes bacterium]|nr:hypothetical protein [Planctomycetota bacterium]
MSERFWMSVQTALDERRDPLGDAQVREWLFEHPEDALEVCELRAALEQFERADIPLRARRRSLALPLAAAAALALIALGAWNVLRPRPQATPALTAAQELELHPVVARPDLGSVQSWELVSACTTSEGTITVRASEGRVETENDFAHRAGELARAEAPVHHEESWNPQ